MKSLGEFLFLDFSKQNSYFNLLNLTSIFAFYIIKIVCKHFILEIFVLAQVKNQLFF